MSKLLDLGDGLVAGANSAQGKRTVSDGATGQTLAVLKGKVTDKALVKNPIVMRIREERAADPAADRDAERLERLRTKAAESNDDSAEPTEPAEGEDGDALTATEAE